MSESPPEVSFETWLLVVLGTAYYFGLTLFLLLTLVSTLPGGAGITLVYIVATFGLSMGIVYFIRVSRFSRPVLLTLWQGSSLYTENDIQPPRKLYENIRKTVRENFKSEVRFIYLPYERSLALIYFLASAVIGVGIQTVLVGVLSNPENLDFATEALANGQSFSLLVAVLSLLEPIIGAAILVVSLLGASGEDTAILIAIVGIPATVVVPGMWNAIALAEQLQYLAVRRIEDWITYNPNVIDLLADWLDKDIEDVYPMTRAFALIIYSAVLLGILVTSIIFPLGRVLLGS